MNNRCVNCGINFDNVNCKNIPNHLVQKLEDWLKPTVVSYILDSPSEVFICEPCLKNLEMMKMRGPLDRNICLGCGDAIPEDRTLLTTDQIQVCRSWAPKDIAVDHLDAVCRLCYGKLTYFGPKSCHLAKAIKEETVFVGMVINEDVEEIDIKSEPEDVLKDSCPLKKNDNATSDQSSIDDNENVDSDISNENDQDSSEELVSISCIKSESDYINYEYLEETLDNTESTSISPKKTKKDKYMGYKGEMTSDDDYIPPPHLKIPQKSEINSFHTEIWPARRKVDDEDYVPTPNLKIPSPNCEIINQPIETKISQAEQISIELVNYRRTTRIGRCIFNNCIENCVSLIPRTVRRKMILEHNIYIPLLSKVCEEHLTDQNWEDISHTTSLFRAEHCQDMKNIITEASRTNFDFENIDTVDSKLVRYWFDLNKGEFNRIFDYFPKLKRLKNPKTAFAVYLMHLQKTSMKRIALLLRMKEKAVKRRIMIVRDIVKCNSFKKFKEKFLEDD